MQITNLTGFEKPATVLIEKISDAIGWIAKPHQVIRLAKADSKAALILAENQLNLNELQQRAMQRIVYDASVQQQNIESIAYTATELLKKDAKPELLEQDWLRNFFDKSKNVSNEDIQKLWARLLAQEANHANSISKRTINLIESFDTKDALLFEKLCQFSLYRPLTLNSLQALFCATDKESLIYICGSGDNTYFNSCGLDFIALSHLETIGLIAFTKNGHLSKQQSAPTALVYFDKCVYIEVSKNLTPLNLGTVMLTTAGLELQKIISPNYDKNYLQIVFNNIKSAGLTVEIMPTESGMEKLYKYYLSKESKV